MVTFWGMCDSNTEHINALEGGGEMQSFNAESDGSSREFTTEF